MQNKQLDAARCLLAEAGKINDAPAKRRFISLALDIFEDLIDDNPSGSTVKTIQNIRKSFARSLPNQIEKMNMDSSETSKFYTNVFLLNFAKEINELWDEPNFKQKCDWLTSQIGPNLLKDNNGGNKLIEG